MSYNSESYAKLRQYFDEKHMSAQSAAETRARELEQTYPEIDEIDKKLMLTGPKIMQAALFGGDIDARIKEVELETKTLRKKRADFLVSQGIPPDFSDVRYECKKCLDTGFENGHICSCFRRALNEAAFKNSGISELMKTQSFENFSLKYYSDDAKTQKTMERNLEILKSYAETFTPDTARSLLFLGATGLGKTHMSTSIAKVVIERGYEVIYDCAQNIFTAFENEKFHNQYRASDKSETEKYLRCELLIIDDLGTEMSTAFTVSCLYNILNTRVMRALPTIINTNFNQKEIVERYGDRIASRLFGEFLPLVFLGRDIRAQKIKNNF